MNHEVENEIPVTQSKTENPELVNRSKAKPNHEVWSTPKSVKNEEPRARKRNFLKTSSNSKKKTIVSRTEREYN